MACRQRTAVVLLLLATLVALYAGRASLSAYPRLPEAVAVSGNLGLSAAATAGPAPDTAPPATQKDVHGQDTNAAVPPATRKEIPGQDTNAAVPPATKKDVPGQDTNVAVPGLYIDVGANRGRWTNEASPKATRIVSVEANPILVEKMRKRFYNRRHKITIVHAAIDEVDNRTIDFYLAGNESTMSSARPDWLNSTVNRFGKLGWMKVERVTTRTLDSLIAEYGVPVLLKVDVEGFEANAFRGLSRRVPLLCFEWSAELTHDIDFILRRLHGLGFAKAALIHGDSINHNYLEQPREGQYLPIPDMLRDLTRLARSGPFGGRGWGMVWVK